MNTSTSKIELQSSTLLRKVVFGGFLRLHERGRGHVSVVMMCVALGFPFAMGAAPEATLAKLRLSDSERALQFHTAKSSGQKQEASYSAAGVILTDTDDDGIPDAWESGHGLNPNDPNDAWLDPDMDHVVNLFEFQLGSDPHNASTPLVATVAAIGATFTSLAAAIDAVTPGTCIRVAGGTYVVNYITFNPKVVMIQGGWNLDFTQRDLRAQPTILDGQMSGSVLYFSFYSDTTAVILDGLNFARGSGAFGAVNLLAQGTTVLRASLLDCSITQSTSTFSFGGVLNMFNWDSSQSDRTLANTIISDNDASGVYAQITDSGVGRWRVINTTISHNRNGGGNNGYGIEAFTLGSAILSAHLWNSILWGNTRGAISIRRSITFDVDHADVDRVDASGAVYRPGPGVLNADPLFANPAAGDFHLQTTSPLLDRGITAGIPPFDFEGDPRNSGAAPDLGADEVEVGTPLVITCPANILTNTDLGPCSALVAFSVQATGEPAPVVTCTVGGSVITSPFAFPVGVNAVTCSASNAAGVTTCTFTVTVVDTTLPTILCPPPVTVNADPGQCSRSNVTWTATASDNCDLGPTVTCVPPSGSTFPVGVTIVTCTAVDAAGNTNSCSFIVTVRDTEPPQIACAANITVEFESTNGAAVSFVVTATDNCAATVDLSCVPASGSSFPIGTTTVVCTAMDIAGNLASCSFQVTVLGARGVKENVLAELVALRSSVTNATAAEGQKLDDAIRHLGASLNPEYWVDQTHLHPKGGNVAMNEEKLAVNKLQELMQPNQSPVPPDVLQGFIDRVLKCDRLLAIVSIQQAAAAGLNPQKIEEDMRQVLKGDAEAVAGRCENAIEHYRNAWRHALHLRIKVAAQMVNGGLQLEFLVLPGVECAIQASTNLTDWVTLGFRTAGPDGVVVLDDPSASRFAARFYRVMEVP